MDKNLSKILLFTCKLINPGGAERLMLEEAKYFEKKGIKIKILTFALRKEALFDHQDIESEVIKNDKLPWRLCSLRRKLQEIDPELVIAQSSEDCLFLYLATLGTKIKYLTHIHGTLFWFHDEFKKYGFIHKKVFQEIRNSIIGHKEFVPLTPKFSMRDLIKINILSILDYLAVRKARKIITLTEHQRWEIKNIYKKDAVVARGCLNPELFNYKPRFDIKKELALGSQKIILSIGRLDRRKRIDMVILAFAKFNKSYRDSLLLIGGMGPELDRLKALAKELKIEEKVKFLGFIPEDRLFDFYWVCDVFVFPCWASFGITRYEALALGKKVVSTSEVDDSLASLWPGHVLVANPDIDSFSEAMARALNSEVKEKIDLSDYAWDRYFERVYLAAEEVMKNKN